MKVRHAIIPLMKKAKITLKTLFSVLVLLTSSLVISSPPNASATNPHFMPTPSRDPFFRAEYVKSSLQPGDILEMRGIKPQSLYYPNAIVKQFAFVSKNTFNRNIRATATLVLPPYFDKNTKIIAYDEWIDSLGTHCNPGYMFANSRDPLSYEHIFSSSGPTSFIQQIMMSHKNYGLLIPDANGPNLAFGANILSAHIALDAIRALKKLPGYNFAHKKIGVFGYSGGAMIAGWQAILEKSYAPDLRDNIIDYLFGGTPVDLVDLARSYNVFKNTPTRDFGIAVTLLEGIEREYPHFNLSQYLSPQGFDIMERVKDQCLLSTQFTALFHSGANLFRYLGEEHFPRMLKIARENSLINSPLAPSKHVTMYYAQQDTEIPQVDLEVKLANRWKRQGANVTVTSFPGDHIPIGIIKAPWVLEYFNHLYKM